MAPGAMVEGAKVEIEGEKCGLNMNSYEDLPPTSVGGASNGDGKDDYVFVNGSDAGSDDHVESDVNGSELDASERKHVNGDSGGQSEVHTRGGGALDDPGERGENGVVNFSGSNVETSEKIDNGHGDKVGNEINGDGAVLEVGNDRVDAERDNEGKVEGAELVKANGQVNLESEIVHKDVQLPVANGGTSYVESDVDVMVQELDVEGNRVNPLPNEVEDGELYVRKEDNCNPSVDDATACLLDDDDDKVKIRQDTENGSDPESPDKGEEVQNETPIVEASPLISDGDQVKPPEVEDNIQLHLDEVVDREMEPLDSNVKDRKPSECDIECQLPGDDQSLEGEVKAPRLPAGPEPHSLDGDSTELLVGDVINENQTSDDQQPESQPADEGNQLALNELYAQVEEECDLDVSTTAVDSGAESCNLNQGEECEVEAQITAEVTASLPDMQDIQTSSLQSEGTESQGHEQEEQNEVTEQGHVDPSATSVNEEVTSLDSEAVMCELTPIEECEMKVQSPPGVTVEEKYMKTSDSDSLQSEEVGNQHGVESTAASVEGQVSDITMHVDASEAELSAEVGVETKKADEKIKSDLIAEVAGNEESLGRDAVVPDQLTEKIVSVNVIDNEISLKSLDSEKTMVVEELSSLSEIQIANDAAVYEDRSDLGTVCLSEKVPDDQAVPALDDTPNDADGSIKSAEGELIMPVASEAGLAGSSVVDTIQEQAVDNAASAADTAHTVPQPKVECANGSVSDHVHDTNLKITETNGESDVTNKSTCISTDKMKSKISFGSFVCEAPFSGNDVGMRPEVSDRSVELTYGQTNVIGADSESKISPVNDTQNSEANGIHLIGLNHDKTSVEVPTVGHVNTEEVQSLPIPASGVGAARGQSTDFVRRPFYYLVRVPRYEDEKLKEQIRLSELQVAEKTRSRDAVRIEYQKRKGGIIQLKSVLEAAKSEERAARELVKAKRREIDSSQSLVNLAKTAITVEDVQVQILNMEHKIQHETLHLKEEKQLVREIKQMRNLKDQLYGNAQKQEEIKQALDQKEQVEEHLKVLRKELASLRDNLSKAEESVKVARKRHDEESASINELYIKFTSADTVRQEAYARLLDLKKQWSEKNKHFWSYKDAARAANNFVDAGDKDSLDRHCVDQVEKFMELWDKNDEFRKEYTKWNTRSTLRRFGTLDGRSLGPDEEPPSIRNVSDGRATASAKINSMPNVSTMERDFPAVAKAIDANPLKNVVEQKNKSVSAKKKAEVTLKNNSTEASGRIDTEEEKAEEHRPTKEEEELARRAEQQKRGEEEARLREQRRQEEKAKAQEALERKKRMQEKARAKAEFKARKEAEEKEKEKEKRAKKKEKKQGVCSEPAESEPAVPLESPSETTREPEVTEKPVTVTASKKPQKPSLYAKQLKTTTSIPAALRNRGKRRMQQWMWALATVVAVLALFFLGNSNFLRNINLLGFGPSY